VKPLMRCESGVIGIRQRTNVEVVG